MENLKLYILEKIKKPFFIYATFALNIFLGAFLVFLVQPLIARYILPWFGGSRSVWSASMLFFQVGLLGGYAYAFGVSKFFKIDKQIWVHACLLILSAFWLPITPDGSLKPDVSSSPAADVLFLLLFTVGVPYAILSATGPLYQHWLAIWKPNKSPYVFYSLSNLGSLLGLLIYPFAVEPNLYLQSQTVLWSVFYSVFIFISLCMLLALGLLKLKNQEKTTDTIIKQEEKADETSYNKVCDLILWVSLSACGTALLLSTTDFMCQDLAVIPFFWIIPLCLYLLTFIITFAGDRFYLRWIWFPLLLLIMQPLFGLLKDHYNYDRGDLVTNVLIYIFGMFAAVMVCHGELFKLRPKADRLTLFYLMVSLGGAAGGFFITFIAPMIFSEYWEFPLSFIACLGLTALSFLRSSGFNISKSSALRENLPIAGFIGLLFLGQGILFSIKFIDFRNTFSENVLAKYRNFYGVARVVEEGRRSKKHRFELIHGHIDHGTQLQGKKKRKIATTYYSKISGVGTAILRHPKQLTDKAMKVGIIGLGAGTLGAYVRDLDEYIFYEIDPNIEKLARTHFTFLKHEKSPPKVVLGDGRTSLERELKDNGSLNFDVMVIDAFSGDAIPIHLLTLEAFKLYQNHLATGGVIAFHISNRHFNLEPLLYHTAKTLNMQALLIDSRSLKKLAIRGATWALLTNNKEFIEDKLVIKSLDSWDKWKNFDPIVWTDDYSSLVSLLDEN
ncbi:MAG: fused MFS/spermidine synthase [Oligoflexales bacterium]